MSIVFTASAWDLNDLKHAAEFRAAVERERCGVQILSIYCIEKFDLCKVAEIVKRHIFNIDDLVV